MLSTDNENGCDATQVWLSIVLGYLLQGITEPVCSSLGVSDAKRYQRPTTTATTITVSVITAKWFNQLRSKFCTFSRFPFGSGWNMVNIVDCTNPSVANAANEMNHAYFVPYSCRHKIYRSHNAQKYTTCRVQHRDFLTGRLVTHGLSGGSSVSLYIIPMCLATWFIASWTWLWSFLYLYFIPKFFTFITWNGDELIWGS